MDLFDTMKSSLFGGTKSDGVEPVKNTSKITNQIQDNFKFLNDMAKDMSSISKSVKSLVEFKGGIPATDANLDTTPEKVPEVEIVGGDKKGMKMPKTSTILKVLGGVLALGGLVTLFWEDIKKAFNNFVSNIYDTIKEQFKKFISSLGKWFSGIANSAMDKLKTLKEKFVNKVSEWFKGISEWVGGKIESVIKFFEPVMNFIKSAYQKFKDVLKGALVTAMKVPGVRSLLLNMAPGALEFAGVELTDDEKKEIIRQKLEDEGKLIDVSLFEKLGTRGKDAKIRARLQEEANQRLIEEEFQKKYAPKPKPISPPEPTRDHSSQYKITSDYVTTRQPLPEGKSSKSPSNVTTIAGDENIKSMIIGHEGVRYEPYKDSLGLWTVGVGHLIGNGKTLPKDADRVYSGSEVAEMFQMDYAHHKKIAERTPGYNEANESGKAAMIDLAFNMGKWWPKWPNTSKALKEGDFEKAARGLEDSKWYGQVGNRAKTIVSLIESAGDQSGGSELSVASSAIGAGRRAMGKPKTPNVINNSQTNNTVVVKNESVRRCEKQDLSDQGVQYIT